jgi:hypothetical protein
MRGNEKLYNFVLETKNTWMNSKSNNLILLLIVFRSDTHLQTKKRNLLKIIEYFKGFAPLKFYVVAPLNFLFYPFILAFSG